MNREERSGAAADPADARAPLQALRFIEASKTYFLAEQSVTALTSVTVAIEKGEFVALVGRSGCGKSTFLNLAGAVDLPSGGEVLVDGQPTRALDDDDLTRIRRDRVGFVFQAFHLFPTLNALENIELPLQIARRPDPRSRARELLALVGMADLGDRMPHQLSGGQMQRVAIARALGRSPALLLADEPTGNLDTETSTEIMGLFQRANRELGTTIVMATHSADNALCARRILEMRDGRLVRDAPVPAGGERA